MRELTKHHINREGAQISYELEEHIKHTRLRYKLDMILYKAQLQKGSSGIYFRLLRLTRKFHLLVEIGLFSRFELLQVSVRKME